MNRLRHTRRRGALSCWILRLLLLVFAFRLLLPSGLMPGAIAPAQGFGLVLCSGHGELVLPETDRSVLVLEHVGSAAVDVHDSDLQASFDSGWPPQHSSPDAICPYAAVFAHAILPAVLLLLAGFYLSRPAAPVVRRRSILRDRLSYARPLARAPPLV